MTQISILLLKQWNKEVLWKNFQLPLFPLGNTTMILGLNQPWKCTKIESIRIISRCLWREIQGPWTTTKNTLKSGNRRLISWKIWDSSALTFKWASLLWKGRFIKNRLRETLPSWKDLSYTQKRQTSKRYCSLQLLLMNWQQETATSFGVWEMLITLSFKLMVIKLVPTKMIN